MQAVGETRLERRAAVAALEAVAQQLLERRIERDHGQLVAQAVDALHDRAAERLAHVAEQHERILRARRVLGERLGDRADVAHRHAIDEQLLHHLDDDAERQRARREVLDELRRALREPIEQVLHLLVTEQLVRVALQELAQVRRDDGARVDDREAERLRVLLRGRLDPVRVEAERRVLRRDADDLRGDTARD